MNSMLYRYHRNGRRCRNGLRLLTGVAGVMWLVVALAPLPLQSQPSPAAAGTETSASEVVVARLRGPIGPASADYLRGILDDLDPADALALVLELDTPGGLVPSMREMIQSILNAPVPVLTYVSPRGARAASAGTYLLYASHVAAMAPGTNVGAATPVALGRPGGDPPADADGDPADNTGGTDDDARQTRPPPPASAMEAKLINDAVAYIRSLAELRDRNADWAEQAVREAQSLTAGEAAERNVTDLVARDIDDLLARVDGRVVDLRGSPVRLELAGLSLRRVEPDWRIRLLSLITNPNIALLLLTVGFFGLVFELLNPGTLLPGIVGAIALVLALYAFSLLPVSLLGMVLLLLGFCLLIAEAFVPSFGILGIGGLVSFSLGALVLFDTDAPGFQLALPVIAGVGAGSALITLLIGYLAVRSLQRKGVSGEQGLTGRAAAVLDWSGVRGHVFIDGERWPAQSAQSLDQPHQVRVTGLTGNTLSVEAFDLSPSTTREHSNQ